MEADNSFEEIKDVLRQIVDSQKETDRITKENAKLIGGLGNKFGSFTEGMAFPSMEKILQKRFGMETVSPRVRTRKGDRTQEIDALGYANGAVNTVVIVEVKSHLRQLDVDQIKKLINNFPYFHPEHQGKKILCIVAYVDSTKEARVELTKMGIMLAQIKEDVFQLINPEGFTPRDFSQVPTAA